MKGKKLFFTVSVITLCSALIVPLSFASDQDSDVLSFGPVKLAGAASSGSRATIINSFPTMSTNAWGCAYTDDVWDVGPASTPDVYELDDPTGSVIQSWSSGFAYTSGVAPADPGHIWIGDWNTDSYAKYTTGGTQVTSPIGTAFNIGDLAFDGTYLWTVDYWADLVHKFDPATGASVLSFATPGTPGGNGCRGITYDPQHACLWISRDNDSNVYQVDPATGVVLFSFVSPAVNSWGLGWDGQYLWITDHSAYILYQVDVGFNDPLEVDVATISEATGGVANFTLTAGNSNASRNYLLLGGVTGTVPGMPLPGGMATLPLNYDAFTSLVITLINTPVFSNFLGTLDTSGLATATFDTLGPFTGGAGLTMYFAYCLNNPYDFASNSVSIAIVQ